MSSSSLDVPAPAATEAAPGQLPAFDPESPGVIRARLLGLEGLEKEARRLAMACTLAPDRRAASPLLRRFVDNQKVLHRAHGAILVDGKQRIHGIDADWLADNFHIVEEVLREIRLDLPRGYDAILPKLDAPPWRGYPRVYALASTLVAHTDSELDETRIDRFVQAFQEVSPLTIGELWALPTMLRLVVIENLRRLAEQMLRGWDERQQADRWCATAVAAGVGQGSIPGLPDDPSDPFLVRALRLLQDQGPAAADLTQRLQVALEARGRDLDEILRGESHRQAVNQVSVGNGVLSLRLLAAIDWNAFFERSSAVHKLLLEDPAGAYPIQDFPTSDRCRKAVERIARGAGAGELDVARTAIDLARDGRDQGAARGHVGHYLIGPGEAPLRAAFGYRPTPREWVLERLLAHPELTYFGAIAALVALAIGGLARLAAPGWPSLLLLAVAAFLPVSELAVSLVNHLLTLLLPPRVLPKLRFKAGVPDELATIVVVPSMLTRPGSAEVLCERLETHYLANPGAGLRFALLTDFADAPQAEMPGDDALVEDALERIAALNRRYAPEGQDLFHLFHRRRLWNPAQSCFMGWERKRGKLSEFNHLLRGARDTTYSAFSHPPESLPRIRFVVTMDADTQMPRDTVGRMIGTLAHPLNQPRFDPAAGRVVEGYGLLQPRVSFHLTAATHSYFAALLAASGGIDPYSTAASDAYMDLFGRGSFTGKGIYDVDAFEAATGDTFPENHILSHDLIEGNYARCGLLSDTEVFDDFPARYNAHARREHRWVRGDWQLLPWLGRTVPTAAGHRRNPLPALERWKLLDNLRRSLVPPGLLVMVVLGWTVLPGSPWLWNALAVLVMALPLLKWSIGVLFGCCRSGTLSSLKSWRESLLVMGGQAAMGLVFLADQARLQCDAIGRTLFRLFVTRKRLLEWETAAATEQRLGAGLRDFVQGMWLAPTIAVAATALVAIVRPGSLWAAFPFLLAWLLSPLAAFLISRPKPRHDLALSAEEQLALRRVARKTWRFFETFVGDADHWLPPDNVQEVPDPRVAHRTSPTNQGLLLASTLAAHDLGYLTLGRLADRLERTIDTLERLEKHRGHFYNWYDTRTLETLPPAYLSTVDSGNLLGCLVALRQGLKDKSREAFLGPAVGAGLLDTLRQVERPDREAAGRLDSLLREAPASLREWDDWLGRVEDAARRLTVAAGAEEGLDDEAPRRAGAFLSEVRERRAELARLAPWASRLRALDAEPAPLDDGLRRWWDDARARLDAPSSVAELAERLPGIAAGYRALAPAPDDAARFLPLIEAIESCGAAALLDRLTGLADRAQALAAAMDFRPLYKEDRQLYTIGINLAQGQLDGPCYDLLASESALTSYLTVARGDAPRRHWFQLGRPFIRAAGGIGLLSWGGTMFEYLMPRLFLRALPGTLLDQACRTAVARQIEYGRELGIPWGVSESAFASQYVNGDYRYQAFGVPGLGLKRGLEDDQVVAPYATAMASMIAPREALANLERLSAEGGEGPYGFYEALDYTADRLPAGQRPAVIRSYMAHHQGMSLVALANVLLDEPMPRRFHREPMVRAAELLLQERVPPDPPIVESSAEPSGRPPAAATPRQAGTGTTLSRRLTTPATLAPRTHLLSNERYHVMVTNAGSGYSRCQGLDLTRWREDPTLEGSGQFVYVRDVRNGTFWSAGHQPVCRPADDYEVVFSADRAAFRRRDGEVETLLEVAISPEELAEVRRLTLTNHGAEARELEVTSYLEPVLNFHAADLAHPAFGKLFVETEHLAASDALTARRRPRSGEEPPVWAVHAMAVDRSAAGSAVAGELEFETDRGRFVGRGQTPAAPAALEPGGRLSGTVGPVLDPALSLRRRFRIEPGGSAVVGFTLAMAESHEAAHALADKYHSASAVARAFELAWAQSRVEDAHRNWSPQDAHLYQRLASHLLFAGTLLRATPPTFGRPYPGRSALDAAGLSVDRPICLVKLMDAADLGLARQVLTAHEFLRLKGLEIDLVVLNEDDTREDATFRDQLRSLIGEELLRRPGGVFVLERAALSEDALRSIEGAARVVLDAARGSLAAQLDRIERSRFLPEPMAFDRAPGPRDDEPAPLPADLMFFNGLGGFTPDGREYCLRIEPRARHAHGTNGRLSAGHGPRPFLPPAPWVNVVANDRIGFLVSEGGAGCTWAGNSQTNRLTPWNNDPVVDPPGEVIYVRDEATGEAWCPTPLPVVSPAATVVAHGQGYTRFERRTHGLEHELTLFVPPDDPVKVLRLRVRNAGPEPRSLSATFFAEWVLGATRERSAMHVVTEVDPVSGALLARNPFREDFAEAVAFADVNRRPRTLTADRNEFLGRHGSLAAPAALERVGLSGRTGAAMDPCATIQTAFELAPGEQAEIVFLLGEAEGEDEARALVDRYRDDPAVEHAFQETVRAWDRILQAVQVETPDPAFDLLLNRWLLYQVVGCRLWGRTAFYQSSGAYGFRDQLQDVMALVHAAPELTREHLLRAAARQFREGDVQHWWLPPSGRGVRTRISDDRLWLAAAAVRYVEATGDRSVLDERVPFLDGPPLAPGREDEFRRPDEAAETASLYEHCVRAVECSLATGVHGLPLIGGGDWNDGFNRVGVRGEGESVWLAWFLVDSLRGFADLAQSRGDAARSARYRETAQALFAAVEAHGWDGGWYLRAFLDDGRPLGSAANPECRIDSIAQSWAVIAGQKGDRGRRAMQAVHDQLFRPDPGLVLLLSPPFDRWPVDPGYIKGYLPGVRENGAQYTHAATWVVRAAAELGQGGQAHALFSALNPIHHASDPAGVGRYRVEPYAVAGDVLNVPPHEGRGGWTWYTGAAAWLYRVGLESLLGLRRDGDRLTLDPCIPAGWAHFRIAYRHGSTTYRITVENPRGVERGVGSLMLDGEVCAGRAVQLADDHSTHDLHIIMGS